MKTILSRPLATLLLIPCASQALDFNLGSSGATLNWDTTVKYSTAFRLRNPDGALIDDPAGSGLNQDDGDRNFGRGLISNRFDLFSEADLKYGNFGARVSGAAWYDTVYNRGTNDNDSPGTSNNRSVPYNQFTTATRDLAGRKGELLDAFVFGKADLGSVPATFRAGRHTLYWGETFFFSNNGIAGTMGPVDATKALSVPNTPAKEIFRPVGQVSGQLQFTNEFALGAYYQYRWERSVLPPAGSYFSAGDILDVGAECFRFAPVAPCGTPGATMLRDPDIKARDSGQYGLQLKLKTPGIDYGAYATVYHGKTPYIYFHTAALPAGAPLPPGAPPFAFTGYQLVFPESTKAYGLSASTTIEEYQFAGEFSIRRNAPLAAGAQVVAPGVTADNDGNPLYPVGNTAHLNMSVLASLPSNFIARSSSLTAELAWNRTTSITKNPAAVEPRSTRDATAMRISYTPTYTQVMDGLDLDVPIGLGYTIDGKSSAVQGFGVNHGGDFSIGLKGTYLAVWNVTLNFTRYFGPTGNTIGADGAATFAQAFKDRQYVSFSASTTF